MPDTQITDEMLDCGAKAIYNATPRNKPYVQLSAFQKDKLRTQARAALEAALAGHVVVPREPTEAMLSAGDSKMPQIAAGQDITTGYDALKEAWPAMIQAAPQMEG